MKKRINRKGYGVYVIVFNDGSIYIGSGCDSHNMNGSELAKRVYQFKNKININKKIKQKTESGCIVTKYRFIEENMSRDSAYNLEKSCIKGAKRLWKEDVLNIRDY